MAFFSTPVLLPPVTQVLIVTDNTWTTGLAPTTPPPRPETGQIFPRGKS